MRYALICCIPFLALAATGCSVFSSKNKPLVYAAGEKATIGPLVYSVTDTEVTQQLGNDPKSARSAQQRFYLVKVNVSNASTEDKPIPAMTLVDDDGQTYPELADGTGVANWLGVVRKVGPTQTEQGTVAFDAPTKHYRLRLNDPDDEKEIAIDIPITFVHEMGKFESPAELPKN
jgi:hypothetical protein